MMSSSKEMSSIDDIWASMNEESMVKSKKKQSSIGTVTSRGIGEKKKKIGGSKAKEVNQDNSNVPSHVSGEHVVESMQKKLLSYQDMTTKLSRDIQALGDENQLIRRKALAQLEKTLFYDNSMDEKGYSQVFHDICKPIFKRYADSSEKCREISQRITKLFFDHAIDFVPVLGYYFPALMQRLPAGLAYDEDLQVFVTDIEAHNAYKRGKAVDRQDKIGTLSGQSTTVVEPAEEIRNLSCEALYSLIKRVKSAGATPILHPYFEDIVMYLQMQLKDPYPELKMTACQALECLATTDDYEAGMKFYSVALVRSILPVLRHRHAKVRVVAVTALHYVMIVQDRAKRKAAGSAAIQDLVGFREENILPIAAFYKNDVQLNYLAELVGDSSPLVREKLVLMLTALLTEIGDRYDHQTRLLPYLLDLLTDEVPSIAASALHCLQLCGKEYEADHHDEIIEKRQYGVDGDERINLDKPLPPPFTSRPRIGIRLYVRGNTKRFLIALVNELTNWIAPTRLKSANLLKMIIVLCEEHLTMEIHTLLPSLINALKFARDDRDVALQQSMLEMLELLGRYLLPEIYLYYILPRLRGDADVVQFGVDAETRITVMQLLQALLSGSKSSQVLPFFDELITVLTDAFVISNESTALQAAATQVIASILSSLKGKGKHVIEAHYVATGRITSLQVTIRKIFRYLLSQLPNKELRENAALVLQLLSELENDTESSVKRLFLQHSHAVLEQEIQAYDVDNAWSSSMPEHQMILRLLECPVFPIQTDSRSVSGLLSFILVTTRGLKDANLAAEVEEQIALGMSEFIWQLLRPFCSGISSGFNVDSVSGILYHNFDETAQQFIPFIFSELNQELLLRHMAEVLEVFVLSPRWSRSQDLMKSRLRLFQLILFEVEEKSIFQESLSAAALSWCINNLKPLLQAITSSSLQPSIHATLRLDTVTTLIKFLTSVREFYGLTRLRSSMWWKKQYQEGISTTSGLTLSSWDKYLAVKYECQPVIHSLLQCLMDANDDVRNAVLDALLISAAFIVTESELHDCVAEENRLNGIEPVDLTRVLQVTVQQLVLECDKLQFDGSYIDKLDLVIRTLTVIDPVTCESVIREAVKGLNMLDDNKLSEVVSGLMNHIEVLTSLP